MKKLAMWMLDAVAYGLLTGAAAIAVVVTAFLLGWLRKFAEEVCP